MIIDLFLFVHKLDNVIIIEYEYILKIYCPFTSLNKILLTKGNEES